MLLVQVYIFTSPSKEIPLDKEIKVRVKEPVYTAPTTTPEKQSILLGFGGFVSNLPKIQHDFTPEPQNYTKQREERRSAVKASFLHGWTGYSK